MGEMGLGLQDISLHLNPPAGQSLLSTNCPSALTQREPWGIIESNEQSGT